MEIQGNELRIICPPGMEIDKENSTFECIKFKPIVKRWRDSHPKVTGYYLSGNSVRALSNDYHEKWDLNRDVFASEKQAKSAFAMAQISQIMANDKRFGGAITDKEWCDVTINKFFIYRAFNGIRKDFQRTSTEYYFLAFHTAEQRDLFLKENEDLIKDYLMID